MLHIFKRRPSEEGRNLRDAPGASTLQAKMRLGLIPPIILVLVLTGYLSFRLHAVFINEMLESAARLQVQALSRDVESYLAAGARDLRLIARNAPDPEALRNHLATLGTSSGIRYLELSFISQKTDQHRFFFTHEKEIHQAAPQHADQIDPGPLSFYDQLSHLAPGQVWASKVLRLEYPLFSTEHPNQKVVAWVIFFGTPVAGVKSGQSGYLLLAAEVRGLRDILTRHRAETFAIRSKVQGTGKGGSYFVDAEGWILFEAEAVESPITELGTDMARADFSGTLGNENLSVAFLPDQAFESYWRMIADIRYGRSGVIWQKGPGAPKSILGDRYTAYAPVWFHGDKTGRPTIYGGVTISERSRLTEIAMFKQIDIIFIIILVTVLLFIVLIELLGRTITLPIRRLVSALDHIRRNGSGEPLSIKCRGQEIQRLQAGINQVLEAIQQRSADEQMVTMERQAAALKDLTPLTETDIPSLSLDRTKDILSEMVGVGPKIERLKQEILKAARAGADVLILGETGTGKQLTAEAIHRHSQRCNQPFVAINCGELDENLLLDTLFGHVKGAFTEARTGRKGAFLEAEGGILFLDEIQTASPRVQQALLRATAQRKIKPLGSDKEIDIDVRLIAATNADLSRLVEQGVFRQDLYFRLKVITIATPSLREQPESIVILAWHYFLKAREMARKEQLLLTKGAMEKMKRYRWPGNVRELINCITRAVVMAEGRLIRADDMALEGDDNLVQRLQSDEPGRDSVANTQVNESDAAAIALHHRLNTRQANIYPLIVSQGGITRSEYHAFWEGAISSRTALYDLQDLVDKGLLRKLGQGPATRYVPCANVSPQQEP
ncbi:sigma 54-interacting transcriptional regulator [Desulfatitalea tepidiphila]|uniref:sigma 54-interacting transcriptional regulator n=1 Tax=Desulfatitalea tepidiphila TaxID=1185843 RepID=UPI0006B42E1B|nr:sigma 54-interacting transcriptional regulator [Desulfatitalea tepidiphila]